MNQITKRNRLAIQLISLAAFLPQCPDEYCQQLIDEMIRIKETISEIKKMTLAELHPQLDEYTVTLPSKMNSRSDITLNTTTTNYGKRTA